MTKSARVTASTNRQPAEQYQHALTILRRRLVISLWHDITHNNHRHSPKTSIIYQRIRRLKRIQEANANLHSSISI